MSSAEITIKKQADEKEQSEKLKLLNKQFEELRNWKLTHKQIVKDTYKFSSTKNKAKTTPLYNSQNTKILIKNKKKLIN